MKKFLVLLICFTFTTAGSFAMLPLFQIETPYAFATSDVQKNGAVFLTLKNNHQEPITVLSAETDVAEKVELHTNEMDGDMMNMRQVESYDVANGETLTLEPMGHHIMLMGLKAPLKIGEQFDLVLHLDEERELRFKVDVIAPGTKPESPAHDHGKLH